MDVWRTVVLFACGFTTYAGGSTPLMLTSFPATASPGQPYILMCSSSSGSRTRQWYWRNDVIFSTNYVSDKLCRVDAANNDLYQQLSRHVNMTCSQNQHNVTLRILTSIDNGSVWWCLDYQAMGGPVRSNNLTITKVNHLAMASTTSTGKSDTVSKTSQTVDVTNGTMMPSTIVPTTTQVGVSVFERPESNGNQVVYIAVGVGGGVVVVIVVVVGVLCIRRKRGRPVNKGSTREEKYETPTHVCYNENPGFEDQDITNKVQVENDIYETSQDATSPNQPSTNDHMITVENDIYETSQDATSPNQPSTNDHMITDIYAQVMKPKGNKPGPPGTAGDINIEDLYAKPDKTKIWKKQED
ncbi:uncharacterized protein LOC124125581 isoform X2 [Haliotis rufescens]|uniref:uncharacterized protein LOC124125581 isoform X2 n=1 Tax=Haliotis rufescens TaxID=6454 RepID=UPI00201F40C5|nr:uncharacterized protein LOC124125581 isoform X2 [Haliotis rufescens]XP_048254191.1 uncharacterized protein LOC124125581 isoform X2 [Haliotis rufescens]